MVEDLWRFKYINLNRHKRKVTILLLLLFRTIMFSFSTLDSLLMLYIAIARFKLEYSRVVWNSITNTDSNKLEHIQRKFAAL
jgi:hypothetical protein